ncbi:MAG: hypothetical protein AABW68_01395 [archaeon]
MKGKGKIRRWAKKASVVYRAWKTSPRDVVIEKFSPDFQRNAAFNARKREVSDRYLHLFDLITRRFSHITRPAYQVAGRPYWRIAGVSEIIREPQLEKDILEFRERVHKLLQRREREIARHAEETGFSKKAQAEANQRLDIEAVNLIAERLNISQDNRPKIIKALQGMHAAWDIDKLHVVNVISQRIYKNQPIWQEGDSPQMQGYAVHFRNLAAVIGGPYRARWVDIFYRIVRGTMAAYFTKLSEGKTPAEAETSVRGMWKMGTKLAARRIKKALS